MLIMMDGKSGPNNLDVCKKSVQEEEWRVRPCGVGGRELMLILRAASETVALQLDRQTMWMHARGVGTPREGLYCCKMPIFQSSLTKMQPCCLTLGVCAPTHSHCRRVLSDSYLHFLTGATKHGFLPPAIAERIAA